MSTRGHAPSPAPGHDILARYLHAYVNARQLSDLERPWGLGNDGLDALWSRLTDALARNPKELNRLIASELTEEDRLHIARTITPLVFALPLRAYPSEVRAIRSGQHLILSLRHLPAALPASKPEKPTTEGWTLAKHVPEPAHAKGEKSEKAEHGKEKAKDAPKGEEPMGHLPAALTATFVAHLRNVLGFEEGQMRRDVTVSSGGRRRRVRVTMLARDRGIVVRFLERLASPADENR